MFIVYLQKDANYGQLKDGDNDRKFPIVALVIIALVGCLTGMTDKMAAE